MTTLIILILFSILEKLKAYKKIRLRNYISSEFIKMSTITKNFSLISAIFLLIFLSVIKANSQDIELKVTLNSSAKSVLLVEGKILKNENLVDKNWSFLQSYADAQNLGKRVRNFRLFDNRNSQVSNKKFADGVFVAESVAEKFSYEIDLSIPENKLQMAHVSWIDEDQGMLMFNDLLPQFEQDKVSVSVEFKVPQNWQVSSAERKLEENKFQIKNLENSVFMIGNDWKEQKFRVNTSQNTFIKTGEWQFEDTEATEMAQSIFNEYSKLFGQIPFDNTQIYLIRLPKELGFGRWRAETRGNNIVILSSSMPFKSQAIQRLHEQLRHEIFHLWIPNSLNLGGDYAWFYEGFAVYQALKTGVWIGQIRFEDFLNTISQAHNISKRSSNKFSLIDTSKTRWNSGSESVYSKGLLVAFLCDVALLKSSKGKRNIRDVFINLYQNHGKKSERVDANSSILEILRGYPELNFIIEKHIKGSDEIKIEKYIASIGIENTSNSANTNLRLKKKLRGKEKAILKKLGYNRWREILRKQR